MHRWSFVLPLAAAVVAHAGSLQDGFVFDDNPSIVDNVAIRAGDPWGAAFGARHSPIANRPLPALLLWWNHAASGLDARSYHLVNLLLHLANVWLVAAVLRHALLSPGVRGAVSPGRAHALAIVTATLWAVHPLGVDAVAYVTQRTTLLMSLFLLAAIRWLQRSHDAARPLRWEWAAAAMLGLGMASKEELVAAPLLLVLYERAFLVPSWHALRGRLPTYARLASSWLVLALCVLLGPSNPTVGWSTLPRASAFEWLCTQAGVLVHYLRLVVWPTGLRGAYDWPIVRDLGPALLPGLVVLALLAATVLAWRRWPWAGFLGAWFFLLLAPTSSVLPIVTEVVAERRMYLPMLAVLVPLVLGAEAVLRALLRGEPRRVLLAFAFAIVVSALVTTQRRGPVYGDEARFWADAFAKNELTNGSFQAANVLSNQGLMLRRAGDAAGAHALFERAMACECPTPIERLHWAVSLAEQGRRAEALPVLRGVVRDAPDLPDAAGNLGVFLVADHEADAPERRRGAADPRLVEAEPLLRTALRLDPDRAAFHNALGWLLFVTGRPADAETSLRRAVELEPQRTDGWRNLVVVLLGTDRRAEARAAVQGLLQQNPRDVPLRLLFAQVFLQGGDREGAGALLQDVLRLDPAHAVARQALDRLQRAR